MSKQYKLEVCTTPDMAAAQKVAFTLPTIKDATMSRNLRTIATRIMAKVIRAIPASYSVEQFRNAVPHLAGTELPEGVDPENTYTVIPLYGRFVEVLDGAEREGGDSLVIGGIDMSADPANLVS